MFDLMALLRAIQLFAHSAHFFVARSIFFQDHAFFSEVYQQAESHFDSVTERMIGLGMEKELDLVSVLSAVHDKLKDAPSTSSKENKDFYVYLMTQVEEALELIEDVCKDENCSQGTIDMVAGIGNDFEVLKYKISRRLKG
jgi:DNA-binding ferritin-like protein